jgi:hypothetical protein
MNQWKTLIAVLSMILIISAAHIIAPIEKILLHIVFRFLYLIPIAYAGFKAGKKYGLIAAVISALAYTPHFFMKDVPLSFHIENAFGLVIFCLVGILSGTYTDLKRSYLKRKYDDTPYQAEQENRDTVLLYADDSPISINCASWLAANHLNNNQCNLRILYGPSYAKPGETDSDFLKNKTVSLSALKNAVTQIGFPTEHIEIMFVNPSKKEPLSQIIINEALHSNCKFLLIGKHNLSKAQEFLFGDTAINIIRKSPIPVIVVTSERSVETT